MPIGLGFRVPTIIVSPWTVGGYVCSDTFDHSSLLRLLEARFGVRAPLISDWRRRTVGDLTSAFRFSQGAQRFPRDRRLGYAAATASLIEAQRQARDNPVPTPPIAPTVRPSLRKLAPAPVDAAH